MTGPAGSTGPTGPTGPAGVAGIEVLEGGIRSLAANGADGVVLQCPQGKTAISGGFIAADLGVVLAGSYPEGSDARLWVVEVISLLNSASNWSPNVTCS